MKTTSSIPFKPSRLSRARCAGRRGAALILVLASLIFISTLVLALMATLRSELTISKTDADATDVRILSDTAVNLVMAQIDDATQSAGNHQYAWASQPGIIRLYDDSGNEAGYRKLYSDSNMTDSGAFDSSPGILTPTMDDWDANPALFTDLNEPVNGVYPILDYTTASSLGVQGLSLGTMPATTSSTNPAPMPVRWLYVLSDGTVHVPDSSSSGTKAVIGAATEDNPIVGRLAFWTDDETCKININTASDGRNFSQGGNDYQTFWSTPRFATTGDFQFAKSQPARGEFQRYPGHPATVSLASVFPTMTPQQIFSLVPRISWGGSMQGTAPVESVTNWITTDTDRLFASVDELIFKVPGSSDTQRATQSAPLDNTTVNAAKFFLTATSRAPELNLFGQPRIASWPIHNINDTNYRTANDRLIAFCSTMGGEPFYFTRQENVLPTFDISLTRNKKLLDYLDNMTGKNIPGFGGDLRGKYTQAETRQILTEIFDYIRCTNLRDKTTPESPAGFWPYTFAISTYGGRPKGTNDHGLGRSLGTAVPAYRAGWGTRGFGGRFLQIRGAHLHFVGLGQGAVTGASPAPAVPILPQQLGTRIGMDPTDPTGNTPPDDNVAIQSYLYLSTLVPGEGIEFWSPGHWIEIEGLDQFEINGTNMGFPARAEMSIMGNMMGGGGISGARVYGLEPHGFTYAQNQLKILTTSPTDPLLSGDPRRHFPFFSNILPVPVSTASPTMAFTGGTITVRIYAEPPYPTSSPYTTHGALIEEFPITFPSADFPTPKLATNRLVGTGDDTDTQERWGAWWGTYPHQLYETGNDVMRSVSLRDGDIRQVVGPTPPPGNPFYEVPPGSDYFNSSVRMVPACVSNGFDLSQNGKLIATAPYYQNYPWVPGHINGVTTTSGAPGDWDNGTSKIGDGPFINAADPGSVEPSSTSGNVAYFDNSNTTASSKFALFSPNRQMPGPGMFGSLPTGVQRRRPWQTLLFRPGPNNHPGLGSPASGPPYTTPPDHLLLDYFWMPVVEPYAISEPFSTAGKINLNQQIVPFTYINRMTGLHAALASEEVAMIPKSDANKYKTINTGYTAGLVNARLPLNLSETNGTLRQFREKFDSGKIFRSATEICDIYMVPQGKSWSSDSTARSDWYSDDFAMVGDNTRERPYADVYGKLTTKSNTYTVYFRAQSIRQSQAHIDADPTTFDTSAGDQVVAERRGSSTIERYLDPNDARFASVGDPAQNFLSDPASSTSFSFETYYRTRIINTTLFQP